MGTGLGSGMLPVEDHVAQTFPMLLKNAAYLEVLEWPTAVPTAATALY